MPGAPSWFTGASQTVLAQGGPENWQRCAAQDEICRVEGQATVRYGADNSCAYRNANNEIRCSVNVFGDPAYGKHKTCEYQARRYTGPLASS